MNVITSCRSPVFSIVILFPHIVILNEVKNLLFFNKL